MLLPETVPRRNKITLIHQIHTEKASKPFLGPFNVARPRLSLSNTQAGENECPRDCNRSLSSYSASVSSHFQLPFPCFLPFFSSHSSSPIFLCPSSILCVLFPIHFFQVELIESFLEIPTFSKKPNKCPLRGKARLKFQSKSYPGRSCQNGLQDCTAPFNPWLSCS